MMRLLTYLCFLSTTYASLTTYALRTGTYDYISPPPSLSLPAFILHVRTLRGRRAGPCLCPGKSGALFGQRIVPLETRALRTNASGIMSMLLAHDPDEGDTFVSHPLNYPDGKGTHRFLELDEDGPDVWFCGQCAKNGLKTKIDLKGAQRTCSLCSLEQPISTETEAIPSSLEESRSLIKPAEDVALLLNFAALVSSASDGMPKAEVDLHSDINNSYRYDSYDAIEASVTKSVPVYQCPNPLCRAAVTLRRTKFPKCYSCRYLLPTKYILDKTPTLIVCEKCNMHFFKKSHFAQHIKEEKLKPNSSHHNYLPFKCRHEGCEKRYCDEANRTKHERVSCDKVPVSARNALKFKCTETGCTHKKALEGYSRKADLVNHVQSIHKNNRKPHKCPFCTKRFANQPNVNRHIMHAHPGSKKTLGAVPGTKRHLVHAANKKFIAMLTDYHM